MIKGNYFYPLVLPIFIYCMCEYFVVRENFNLEEWRSM